METVKPPAGIIPSLDGLRAVSILIVFAGHAGVSKLVPSGFGVTVFFFLSGYLITRLLMREYDRYARIDFGAFYLRRVVRLGPPLAVVLLVSAALVWLGLADGDMAPIAFLSQIFFFNNYYGIITGLGSVNGLDLLWSLAVEEHFYLFFPFLFVLIASGRLSVRFLIGLTLAVLAWRFVHFVGFGSPEWVIYRSTDTRIDSILFGCLLALIEPNLLARNPLSDRSVLLVTLASVTVLVGVLLIREPMFRATLKYSVQGLALMPIFFLSVHYNKLWFFKPLNWAWMRRLGLYSYTFYLIHYVIIQATIWPKFMPSSSWMFILACFVLSLAFSAAVFEFVEKPLKPLRSRLVGHKMERATEPA